MSLKEASQQTGKSESTLRQLINDSSPESERPVLQGGIFSMRSERPVH